MKNVLAAISIAFTLVVLSSCRHSTHIGEQVPKGDVEFIRSISLLDDDEQIILFDSQTGFGGNKKGGNFFTNKRIACYWIDHLQSSKIQSSSAYYTDIDSIILQEATPAITYNSYLEVKTKGYSFNVYVTGKDDQIKRFLLEAMKTWRQNKTPQKAPVHAKESSANSDPWNFQKTIANIKTPALAIKIFDDGKWTVDDPKLIALLDSLSAKDHNARPFYFKVISKTNGNAHGLYTKALGQHAKEYIEKNTQEFVHYFIDSSTFTNEDLDAWAEDVADQFSIITNKNPTPVIGIYVKTLNQHCAMCDRTEITILSKFELSLQKHYREMIKEVDKEDKDK